MRREEFSIGELTVDFIKGNGQGAPANGKSIWKLVPFGLLVDPSLAHIFYDDFVKSPGTKAAAVSPYVIVEDDGASGTDAILDAAGGIYKHFCDGDDNDEAYLSTDKETWKFAAGKALWLEARIAITQGDTNNANWIMGLTDQAAANMILDDGGGPAASYDGAVFYGVEGSLAFGFETSNAAVQVTTAPANGWTMVSGTFMNLGFMVETKLSSDTTALITPYVNGTPGIPHKITLAGLEEMDWTIGVKSAGTAEESFSIDYLKIVQIR